MARRKRCVVKRRRKEEGKRRKGKKRREKKGGSNRKKKKYISMGKVGTRTEYPSPPLFFLQLLFWGLKEQWETRRQLPSPHQGVSQFTDV